MQAIQFHIELEIQSFYHVCQYMHVNLRMLMRQRRCRDNAPISEPACTPAGAERGFQGSFVGMPKIQHAFVGLGQASEESIRQRGNLERPSMQGGTNEPNSLAMHTCSMTCCLLASLAHPLIKQNGSVFASLGPLEVHYYRLADMHAPCAEQGRRRFGGGMKSCWCAMPAA